MEFATIPETSLTVSRVGLGTWAIGGWMWGGTDEEESVKTIHAAVERGINLIDTAPAYGFGRSEEIVGRAIADRNLRSRVVIATKTGLEWKDGNVFRNARRDRILREATDSLVAAWTRTLGKMEVFAIAKRHRIPLAPVRDVDEVMGDRHMHERGMLEWIEHDEIGRIVVPTTPLRIHGADPVNTVPSPKLGQHNGEIYGDWLGLSAAEIAALERDGVI